MLGHWARLGGFAASGRKWAAICLVWYGCSIHGSGVLELSSLAIKSIGSRRQLAGHQLLKSLGKSAHTPGQSDSPYVQVLVF